jgi:integrase
MANGMFCLSESQLSRLCSAAHSPRDKVLIQLFVETGVRRFEAASLQVGDVDTEFHMLAIRHGKGNKMRLIPMTNDLSLNFTAIIDGRSPDSFVFQSRQSGKLSNTQVNRIVAEIGRIAGVAHPNPRYKNVSCHLLRHSFARRWKNHRGNIEALSRILGHSSVKTTWDIYGQQSVDDIKRHYQKMMTKSYQTQKKGTS